MAIGPSPRVPDPLARGATTSRTSATLAKALATWISRRASPIARRRVDVVFVGSCTNGRIADMRAVARLLDGRKVASRVRMLVVPGSQAGEEAGGGRGARPDHARRGRGVARARVLDVHRDERRQPQRPGEYAVSTSNRNFEGRQGKGRPDVPRVAAHRCGFGGHGQSHRSAHAVVQHVERTK
jgi:3-isopropylmalate/(R)-2-methylmalate dehydratase large subunit